MTLDEWHSLCPKELDAVFASYNKDEIDKKEWERLQMYILFNAQGGSESVKTPQDLICFPWEKEEDEEIIIPTDINWEDYDRKYGRKAD